MMKQRIFQLIGSFLLACIPVTALAAEIKPGFNPNKLIEDKSFNDASTFGGPDGIQKFLESKNSVLANVSPDFLVKLKEPSVVLLKQGLDDPQPNLGRLRTAAELIWDASRQSGINPQVLLVTLQKEQGLITAHQEPGDPTLQRALDFAFGFNCPDATGCSQNSLFPGFYYQLFGNFDAQGNRYLGAAKSLMKSFLTAGGRGPSVNGKIAKVGDTVEISNTTDPYNVPATQMVTIENNATAALYRFTPHVFNGNYNFYKYFIEWFKYPNGTLLKTATDTTIFVIQNGSRLLLPQFVANVRGLDLSKTLTVSPTELEEYPAGTVYGPTDNTIVQIAGDSQKYVFIDNKKHPASDFVIAQRKLNAASVLSITPGESQLFEQGQVLTPSNGTIVKGQLQPEVYLVEGDKLKLFSSYTFNQRKVAGKIQIIADSEVATYPKSGFVAPLDGTLVKSPASATVYIIDAGLKRPVSAAVFKNRKFAPKNIVTLTNDEVSSFAMGGYAVPAERSVYKVAETGGVYLFKDGSYHWASALVAKQRRITPDFTVSQSEASSWTEGIAVAPVDNTVIKGDKDATIYLVVSAQLRPLTAEAFKKRKITAAKIITLPQAEVDAYAKGEILTK